MDIKLDMVSLAFFVLAGLAILIIAIWIFKTESRLRRFFAGKKAKDLEDTIFTLGEEINKLKSAKEKSEREIEVINKKLKKSLRGLETIRFNPFPDQGSNQSFATALLNEEGNGVVLSSLYSRERTSLFAKPIKEGKSEFELSAEEREALGKAQASYKV